MTLPVGAAHRSLCLSVYSNMARISVLFQQSNGYLSRPTVRYSLFTFPFFNPENKPASLVPSQTYTVILSSNCSDLADSPRLCGQ